MHLWLPSFQGYIPSPFDLELDARIYMAMRRNDRARQNPVSVIDLQVRFQLSSESTSSDISAVKHENRSGS